MVRINLNQTNVPVEDTGKQTSFAEEQKVAVLVKVAKEITDKIEDHKNELVDSETKIAFLENDIIRLDKVHREMTEEVNLLKIEYDRYSKIIQDAKNNFEIFKDEMVKAHADKEIENNKITNNFESKIEKFSQKIDECGIEINNKNSIILGLKNEIKSLTSEVKNQEGILEKLKGDIKNTEVILDKKHERVGVLEMDIINLENQKSEYKDITHSINLAKDELNRIKDQQSIEVKKIDDKKLELDEKMKSIADANSMLDFKIERLNTLIRKAEAEKIISKKQ